MYISSFHFKRRYSNILFMTSDDFSPAFFFFYQIGLSRKTGNMIFLVYDLKYILSGPVCLSGLKTGNIIGKHNLLPIVFLTEDKRMQLCFICHACASG